MKRIKLTPIFICLISFLFSITCKKNDSSLYYSLFPTLEDDPSWNVFIDFTNPSQQDYTEIYSYAYDTIFCNLSYIKVIVKKDNITRHLCYIRIDDTEEKVYVRKTNQCNENEYLLYSFNVEENQSLFCGFNIGNVFPDTILEFKIVQIESIDINNTLKKKIALQYFISSYNYEMVWIEGIGSMENPFYSVVLSKAPGAGKNKLTSFKIKNKEIFNNN
jgi:hypothetical protein